MLFSLARRQRERGFRLLSGGREEVESLDFDGILHQLEQKLLLHVGERAPHRIFLHAGVVGWRGHAILLPGSSCAGKTTLVAGLVTAGAAYYSDDYALLDPDGLVHPYARDLQIRQATAGRRRRVAVGELNGEAGTRPLPVAAVVFTTFVDKARWEPKSLTEGEAVLGMLEHTLCAQKRPAETMAALARVALGAKAFRSERGEAETVLRSLLSLAAAS